MLPIPLFSIMDIVVLALYIKNTAEKGNIEIELILFL
jgi:hypothetical protein